MSTFQRNLDSFLLHLLLKMLIPSEYSTYPVFLTQGTKCWGFPYALHALRTPSQSVGTLKSFYTRRIVRSNEKLEIAEFDVSNDIHKGILAQSSGDLKNLFDLAKV